MPVLKDVFTKLNIFRVALGIIFGLLTIIVPFYVQKNAVLLTIIFFLLSTYFFLISNRLVKLFGVEISDKVIVKENITIVVKDKDGNIKETKET